MIRCKTRCRAERSEDGVALIMVVCVLAALVIIGTPFVLSMRTHELGSRRIQAGVQARFLAEAAVNRAIRMTMESHEQLERLGSDPQGVDYDLFSEFQMLMQSLDIEGQTATLRWRDSRGSLLEATIYDEQGKININSAPGFTLGNLLGVTELVEDLNPKDTEMKVRSVEGEFFSDGDPMTLDGYVRVGAELIAYRHAAGGRISGLMRGFLFSAPTPETLFHPAGTIVQDGRGQKIALHKMWARYGEWTPFETVNSIRQIADWTLLRYVEEKLLTWGVTPDDLEDYGIDLEDLMSQIGINPLRLELPEVERTDEEKAAEKALKNAGLDPEVIRLLGGAGRMQRLADMVERIPEGARSRILDRYKERQSQFEAFMKDLKKYHKDYMPQAVRDVVVLLTEAGDIEAIQASELEEIRDFITVSSSRSRAWSDVQYNQNKVQYQADMRTNYNTSIVQFPRTETIGIGTWIRIVDESTGKLSYRIGMEPEELVPPELMQTGQFQRRRGQVALWPQLTGSHQPGQLRIEAEIPHPVNLNTAHRRVIRALLVGLQGNPTVFPPPEDSQDDFVTLAEAEVLAERILGASLKGLDDLLDLLNIAVDDEVISEQDRNVILKNALNPNDPTLIVSSLPFCY
ncbi:MAG: hypothetical protein O7H41_01100, partial [Planctomycetota bacterium]|nr:hypothetical protein [Planctomycetota bacterium]